MTHDNKVQSWELSQIMKGSILKYVDPVSLIVKTLNSANIGKTDRTRIATVISELYSNALEHGLLNLDSSMKDDVEGFCQYYVHREQGLAALSDEWIKIDIHYICGLSGEKLIICMEDSGAGFSYNNYTNSDDDGSGGDRPVRCRGRGINLMRSMCKELSYHGTGNLVRVVYLLDGDNAQCTNSQISCS